MDGSGMVYLASERDNSSKGVNYDTILMVNPSESGTRLVARKQWDLTATLPQVSANMGVEAVEWVANSDINGKLIDQNTGSAFDAAKYPNAVTGGVFFVALEDNGHVYAYILNEDETVVQIADIDSKLGGAMALDYDTYEKKLWVAADDGYGNRMAQITLNGTENPEIVHVLPAAGVDTTANNEGFAIADASYTVNGQRPAYRFCDGVTSGALIIGSINCGYCGTEQPDPSEPIDPGKPDNPKPSTPTEKPTTPSKRPAVPSAGTSVSTEKTTNVPKTGDSSTKGVLITLAVLSVAVCFATLLILRNQKKKH